ncbi:DUF433 domain-containing protein [Halobacteriales archaeon QH_6_64_20]|nr:MAG: DUF433 domain-containing protein [Halobacteriales archaeon QH_6_64_20]
MRTSSVEVHSIVPGDESDLHDEPHIEGSRITVRYVYSQVEERGLRPESVADRYDLDLADVHAALTYYHRNPEVMGRVVASKRWDTTSNTSIRFRNSAKGRVIAISQRSRLRRIERS